jgi:hypothetical protein
MRRFILTAAALITIIVVVAASVAPADALRVGYGQFGGYDRSGYEFSQ